MPVYLSRLHSSSVSSLLWYYPLTSMKTLSLKKANKTIYKINIISQILTLSGMSSFMSISLLAGLYCPSFNNMKTVENLPSKEESKTLSKWMFFLSLHFVLEPLPLLFTWFSLKAFHSVKSHQYSPCLSIF